MKNKVNSILCCFAIIIFVLLFFAVNTYLHPRDRMFKSSHWITFNDLALSKGCTTTLSISVSPDGKYKLFLDTEDLVSKDGYNKKNAIIRLVDKVSVVQFKTHDTIRDFSWSANSRTLGYIDAGTVNFLDIESGSLSNWQDSKVPGPVKIRYSPDGKYLTLVSNGTGGIYEGPPHYVVVLNAETKKVIWTKKTYIRPQIAWSPDSRFITLICSDESMQTFDSLNNFVLQMTVFGMDLRDPLWSPDSKHVSAFQDRDEHIKIFDLNGVLAQNLLANKALEFVWLKDTKEIAYLHQVGMTLDQDYKYVKINYANIPEIDRKWPADNFKLDIDDKGTILPRYGYLRSDGKEILPNRFFSVHEFKDGSLCAAEFDQNNPSVPLEFKFYSKDGNELKDFKLSKEYRVLDLDHEFIRYIRDPQKSRYEYTRSLMGLSDKEGNVILKPEYWDIWNGGSNTIFACDANMEVFQFDLTGKKLNHFTRGFVQFERLNDRDEPDIFSFMPQIANEEPKQFTVDSAGHILKNKTSSLSYDLRTKISSNLYLVRRSNPGKVNWTVDDEKGRARFVLPKGTFDVFTASEQLIPYAVRLAGEPDFDDSKYRMGFLNLDGKVVIEPKYLEVKPFKKGFSEVIVSYRNGRKHAGLIDKYGNFVINPSFDYSSIEVTDLGNFITTKLPSHHFSSIDFKSIVRKAKVSGVDYFYGLLRDYNLIGMEKSKVISLLGKADPSPSSSNFDEFNMLFSIDYTGHSNPFSDVVFEFKNNRVKRWAFVKNIFRDDYRNWQDKNVVVSFDPNLRLYGSYEKTIPKLYLKSEVLLQRR